MASWLNRCSFARPRSGLNNRGATAGCALGPLAVACAGKHRLRPRRHPPAAAVPTRSRRTPSAALPTPMTSPTTARAARCARRRDARVTCGRRLQGAIEAELDWSAQTGRNASAARGPTGDGVRLLFKGRRRRRRPLAVVIGSAAAHAGDRANVPANLTVIREGSGEFFATQGDDKCALDEVAASGARPAATPVPADRARLLHAARARVVRGEGAVFMSRFDVESIVDFPDNDDRMTLAESARMSSLAGCCRRAARIRTLVAAGRVRHARVIEARRSIRFRASASPSRRAVRAATCSRHGAPTRTRARAQGLMFVEDSSMRPDQAMIFVYDPPQHVSMWMKNTCCRSTCCSSDEPAASSRSQRTPSHCRSSRSLAPVPVGLRRRDQRPAPRRRTASPTGDRIVRFESEPHAGGARRALYTLTKRSGRIAPVVRNHVRCTLPRTAQGELHEQSP